MALFSLSSDFNCPVETLFAYHEQAGAIDRLIPPWEPAQVASSNDSLQVGSIVEVDNWLGPLKQRWIAEHKALIHNELFVDQLNQSPFAKWVHSHRFKALNANRSSLNDEVDFKLPLDPLSRIALPWAKNKLNAMFRFRHQITADDISFGQSLLPNLYCSTAKRIGISGASGLIGRRTVALARALGIEVVRLERTNQSARSRWPRGVQSVSLIDWTKGTFHKANVENLDAWIHLGGVGIADRRWNNETKQAIRQSRTQSTSQIVSLLHQLDAPPKCFVCASGVGAFGNRNDEILSEQSSIEPAQTGDDFLADVAREWEQTAKQYADPPKRGGEQTPLRDPLRFAIARFGMVLHPRDGALSKLLLPFKLGLGGPVGSGKQYWPWVHIDDAASILLHLAIQPNCQGIYHVTAPDTLTNKAFSQTLGRVLHRPAILPAPSAAMRLLLGEMADSLLLSSVRATTDRLIESGYQFRFPKLDSALRNLLGAN